MGNGRARLVQIELSGLKMKMGSWGVGVLILSTMVFLIARVSSNTINNTLTYGYEKVATVYVNQDSDYWGAPCFDSNHASLHSTYDPYVSRHSYYEVVLYAESAKCTWCRDDYQIKLGDERVATGSTFVSGDNHFALHPKYRKRVEGGEGVDIYVDTNPSTACNGVAKDALRNPFKPTVEPVALE